MMRIEAREVGDRLRRCAGKRDHRELMPDDHVVLRPGPIFHGLMGHSAPAELPHRHLNESQQATAAAERAHTPSGYRNDIALGDRLTENSV